MISLSEESLKAIKYIKNAKALSYFRRMVFRRSSLNYGETILGVNELKEKSELVKVPDSNYRFKLKFPQRRRTFKEFLATLVNDELLTNETKNLLRAEGFLSSDRYSSLKELTLQVIHNFAKKHVRISIDQNQLGNYIVKYTYLPTFKKNLIKENFFSRTASVNQDYSNSLTKEILSSSSNMLFLAYPIYLDDENNAIPVFFKLIDRADINKDNSVELKTKEDQFYYLNAEFIKTVKNEFSLESANQLLSLLGAEQLRENSTIDNVKINKSAIKIDTALLFLKSVIDQALYTKFDVRNLSTLTDNSKKHIFINSALLCPFIGSSEDKNKLKQLNKLLELPCDVIDRTSLSCLSNYQVNIDKHEHTSINLSKIANFNFFKVKDGCELSVLHDLQSDENTRVIVNDDVDFNPILTEVLNNQILSYGIYAVVYNKEISNKFSFVKSGNENLNIDFDALENGNNLKDKFKVAPSLEGLDEKSSLTSVLDEFIQISKDIKTISDKEFILSITTYALSALELEISNLKTNLDTILLSNKKTKQIKESCQKLLNVFFSRYKKNELKLTDVNSYAVNNSFFLFNRVIKAFKLKPPKTVEQLQSFISKVENIYKYIEYTNYISYVKSFIQSKLDKFKFSSVDNLRSKQQSLLQLINDLLSDKSNFNKKELLYYLKTSIATDLTREQSDSNLEAYKKYLSVYESANLFNSLKQQADTAFIPALFDKTIVFLDKSYSLADLLLVMCKSKTITFIENSSYFNMTNTRNNSNSEEETINSLLDIVSSDDEEIGLSSLDYRHEEQFKSFYLDKDYEQNSITRDVVSLLLEEKGISVDNKIINRNDCVVIIGLKDQDNNNSKRGIIVIRLYPTSEYKISSSDIEKEFLERLSFRNIIIRDCYENEIQFDPTSFIDNLISLCTSTFTKDK